MIQFIKSNYVITVFINDSAGSNIIQQKISYYSKHPYIESVTYVPADTALKFIQKELGEDVISLLGENPISPSLEIKLKPDYAQSENMHQLKVELEKEPIFSSAYYQENLIEEIEKNSNFMTILFSALTLLITIIVISLIHNTIRLVIYSRRFIIRTMLLVGATKSFIFRPFLVLFLWFSLIASVFAAFLLKISFQFVLNQIPDLQFIFSTLDMFLIFGSILFAGIFISFISTLISLRHYIKLNVDLLYAY
ncbi:MAG: permease-like cell division protein FtsX [Bacteroidales bacterium]|nr:permease-like cell division protein FtsX [Bacteroidales bacterium]